MSEGNGIGGARAIVYEQPLSEPMRTLGPGVADAWTGPVFGYPSTEWVADRSLWARALHPEDREQVLAAIGEAAAAGGTFDLEYRLLGADGRPVWVQDQASVVSDGSHEPPVWHGVMVDVSIRKATEERLRAAEMKYRSLVERIPAIVYIDDVDDEMSTTYISPQVEWLLGVLPQEYIGTPDLWERMLHPDDHDAAMARYLEGRANARPFSFEYRLIARNGRTVWFRDEAVVLTGAQGEPTHVQGVMLDVTEAKEAEEAKRRSEERYGDLVETAQDAVFTLGLDASISSLNPAFERITGWPRDEWIGQPFPPLIHPEDLPIAFQQMQSVTRGESPSAFEIRVRKSDQTYVVGEFLITPQYGSNGEVVGALGIARDITDRKRVGEELREAKDAAEAANRAKSEFLANMSHEIRTPLNAVIGLSDLMLGTELTAEQRDYLETIRSSGDALLGVISDILDFSKIEAGRLDVEHAPFDIRACVEEALDLVASSATTSGRELAYLVDQQVPSVLMGDVTRVRQILMNLLSNAVKFTESGEVVVTVSSRPRDERRHDVHFAVIDTGIGIEPDAMDRLFDSFTQLDASITRKYGGTGLGLAISRHLAERMGGGMWAESTVGAGSTFHFTILAEVGPEHPVRRLVDTEHLRGLRVLVVDDNATNRLIVSKQVRTWDMVPFEAASAAEAIDLLDREAAFDVAILDMCMPGVNGETLAREMRELRGGQVLPLVMLSSLGRRQEDAESSPFAAYLTKPVKPSRLHDTLAGILATSRDHTAAESGEGPRATGNGASASSNGVLPVTIDQRLGERHPLRLLVAEDNAVNQKVVLRMLERIGYGAQIVSNGVEALAALERDTYDVVLMDAQMPQMDGLEASRRIRRTIPPGRRPRVIAMTAHALQGDRERCFEAGMEDYLSKPIDLGALAEVLARSVPLPSTPASAPAPPQSSDTSVLDRAILEGFAEQLGEGGQGVVMEIVEVFLEDTPAVIAELRSAAASGDTALLDRAAHTLKSSSATLGARELSSLCQGLEADARSGPVPDAGARVESIASAYERVRVQLTGLQATA